MFFTINNTQQAERYGDAGPTMRDDIDGRADLEPAKDSVVLGLLSRLFTGRESRFLGVDVYVLWAGSEKDLTHQIDDTLDWSPFQLIGLRDVGPVPSKGDDSAPMRRWHCSFRYHGRSQDGPPYVSSLLDCIEHIAPWYIAEKVFSTSRDDQRPAPLYDRLA